MQLIQNYDSSEIAIHKITVIWLYNISIFIAGVKKDVYRTLPKEIRSRRGFTGCLASLDLNGETPDLIRDAVIPSKLISRGCNSKFQTLNCTCLIKKFRNNYEKKNSRLS